MSVQINEPTFNPAKQNYRVRYKDRTGTWRDIYAKDMDKAWSRYNDLKVELKAGIHIHHKIKFDEVADEALQARSKLVGKKNGIRHQVYANDERHLRRHLRPYFSGMVFKHISTGKINEFIEHMRANEVSPKSQRHYINTLNMVCKFAVSKGYILTNPCAKSEREQVRGSMTLRSGYHMDEIKSLFAVDMRLSVRALMMMGAFTGLAANELQGLQWSDIDLYAGTVSVSRTGYRYQVQNETKTEHRLRTVPMPSGLVSVMREWQLKCHSPTWVFPAENGRMGEQNAWRKTIATVCKHAGIDDKGLGGFRKFYHTQMEMAGVPDSIRKYRMGHSKKSNTAKIHYTDADIKRAQSVSDLEQIAQRVLA